MSKVKIMNVQESIWQLWKQDIVKKRIKDINTDNYDLTHLNNEDYIKPSTGNSVFHSELSHKISLY